MQTLISIKQSTSYSSQQRFWDAVGLLDFVSFPLPNGGSGLGASEELQKGEYNIRKRVLLEKKQKY